MLYPYQSRQDPHHGVGSFLLSRVHIRQNTVHVAQRLEKRRQFVSKRDRAQRDLEVLEQHSLTLLFGNTQFVKILKDTASRDLGNVN